MTYLHRDDGGLDEAIARAYADARRAGPALTAAHNDEDEERLAGLVKAAATAFAARARTASLAADEIVIRFQNTRFRAWTRDRAWRAGGGLPPRAVIGKGWMLRPYRAATPERNGQSSITVTVEGVLIENAEWPRDRRFPVVDDEADAEALLMLMAGYLVDHGVASLS